MPRVLFSWLCIILLLGVSAAAKDVPGQYIVVLAGEPAITTVPVKSSQFAASRLAVRSAQARVRAALEASQVEVIASIETVLNAIIVKAGDPSTLASTPGVAQVFPVRLYKKLLDRAALLQKAPAAWDTVGGWENAGAGIKIGIIDSGIDVSHPAFLDVGFSDARRVPPRQQRHGQSLHKQKGDRRPQLRYGCVRVGSRSRRPRHGCGDDRRRHSRHGSSRDHHRHSAEGVSRKLQGLSRQPGRCADVLSPEGDRRCCRGWNGCHQPEPRRISGRALRVGSAGPGCRERDPRGSDRRSGGGKRRSWGEYDWLSCDGPLCHQRRKFFVGSHLCRNGLARWLDPFIAIPAAARASVTNVRAEITDVGSLDPTGLACAELPSGSLTGKLALILRGTCFFEDKLNVVQRAGAVAAVVYTDEARPEPATMSVGAATLPAVMIGYQDGVRAKQRLANGNTVTAVVDFEAKPFFVNPARLADFTSKGPGIQNLIKPDLVATGTAIYTAQPVSSGEPRYAAMDGTSFSAPMVAGAAALLKAYRPGLSADQYKSLLANSATTFSANEVTFPVQQTGTGLLDITAAVRSSVVATSSSINFGAGESVIDSTQRFTLKNIGRTPDTYSVSVLPLITGATPEVTPNVVDLQPGAAAEITVRLAGANLPAQAYEGFVVVRGTQTEVASRIPYWYAVTNGTVSTIDVVEAPASARRSSTAEFLVRSLDSMGVAVLAEPSVKVVSVRELASPPSNRTTIAIPGSFRVRVRLGSEPGANVFEIDSGSAVSRVTITGD